MISISENGFQYRIRLENRLMYICLRKGITEPQVRELGQSGVTCPRALSASLDLDDEDNCCGRCLENIQEFFTMATDEARICLPSSIPRLS